MWDMVCQMCCFCTEKETRNTLSGMSCFADIGNGYYV